MANNLQHSPEEIQRVQARIDEIAKQIRAGGDFAAQYRADPAGTLQAQGLPDEAVASLLEQAKGENEVSGYMSVVWTWNGDPPSPFDPSPFDPGPLGTSHGAVDM